MATVAEIISNWLGTAWVWSWQYDPNTVGLKRFNEWYHKTRSILSLHLNENFDLNSQAANLVAGQNTYALPAGTSTLNYSVPQLWKLMRVEIKYNANQPYAYKATPIDTNDMKQSQDYYAGYWPQNTPVFSIENDNVVIYPTPKDNITAWLKIRYEPTEINLNYSDPETAIELPWKTHYLIEKYIKYKVFENQQRADQMTAYKNYEDLVSDEAQSLCGRYKQPVEQTTGSFTWLTY